MFRASWIQGEGSIILGVQTKLKPLFIDALGTLKIIKDEI
jgi:hypothetical protein